MVELPSARSTDAIQLYIMVAMPPMYITDRYARVSGISSSGVWSTLSSGSSVISPTAVSASAAPTATYIDDTNVRLTDNSSPAPKYCAMTTDTPVVTPSASDEYRYVATPATRPPTAQHRLVSSHDVCVHEVIHALTYAADEYRPCEFQQVPNDSSARHIHDVSLAGVHLSASFQVYFPYKIRR